jgi:hypothetical protein
MRVRAALLIAIGILSSGCTFIVKVIARNAMQAHLDAASREIDVVIARTKPFTECLQKPGGICKAGMSATNNDTPRRLLLQGESFVGDTRGEPPSRKLALDAAKAVFANPAHTQVTELFNDLQGTEKSSAVDLDVEEVTRLSEQVADATQRGAWDALADRLEMRLAETLKQQNLQSYDAATATPEIAQLAQNTRLSVFIREYMRAYFRNGRFVQVTVDAKALEEKLAKELDSDLAKKMAKEFEDKYGSRVFGVINTEAFVTRDGTSYQFPAVNAQLLLGPHVQPRITKLAASAVGSDLVRVYFEAVFDAHNSLPGVSNATGVTMKEYALAKHPNPATKLTDAEFAAVQQRANQAEAGASAVFGRIIRGGSWISLNNESLAKLLETIVGVVVRKVTEKVAWCWYSCSHLTISPTKPATPAWDIELANPAELGVNSVNVRIH